MAPTLALGDVLEFECGGGWCYLVYAGKDPTMGDAVWVVPEIFPTRQSDWRKVFSSPGSFWLFYPTHASLRAKLVRKIGYSENAIHALPRTRRNIVSEDESGAIMSWFLTDGITRVPKLDKELTEEERQLPVSRIWNHAYLVEQLESGRLQRRSE